MLGQRPASPASLSVHRAFVVAFDIDANFQAGCIRGRVEHVVSGQVTWFQSQETFLVFMAQLLREVLAIWDN